MNVRYLSLILLLLCCAVPLASAGGMAKFYFSPAEASWKTGQTVTVKLMYDNNLNPVARDISLYLDWNSEMLKYEGTEFKVGNTVKAGLLSSHELNLLFGEFTNGYPKGDYPLAVLSFKVIAPGDTPILIRVARLNNMEGQPATFATGKGAYSITGDAVKNPGTVAVTTPPTTTPGNPGGVIVVTPAATYTPIPTVPTAAPVGTIGTVATTIPAVFYTAQPASGGGAPGWPVLTPGARIPTPEPTTVETTIVTTVPTTVPTTEPTTVPTTVPTTRATTTATTVSNNIGIQGGNAIQPHGIAIEENATVTATPTVNRTLPSPLANASNITAETTAAWPADTTASPTLFIVRGNRTTAATTTPAVVNNSSAVAASAGGAGFGDAWMIVLAAVAGIAIVALGVVTMRRGRDDWL